MRIDAVVFAFALGSSALLAAACNKPDANALQTDASYTETVTTASAGATALPPGNAPGGNADADGAATSSAAMPFNQACAGPSPKLPANFGKPLDGGAAGLGLQVAPPSAPAGGASAAAPATCGDKPLPACPMTAWMKANAGPAAAKADTDLPALALVLDKIASFAPAGYPNWASISKDGAAAARSGQLDAARASCRSCHTQYKAKYKAESRALPLP